MLVVAAALALVAGDWAGLAVVVKVKTQVTILSKEMDQLQEQPTQVEEEGVVQVRIYQVQVALAL
jgi:hypothetical protein